MAIDFSGMNQSLQREHEVMGRRVSPLQRYEEQRRQLKKESQTDRELDIEEYSAKTSRMTSETAKAKHEAEREDAANIKKMMESYKVLYGPKSPVGTPEHLRESHIYAAKLAESSDLDIAEHGRFLLDKLEAQAQRTTLPGEGQDLGTSMDVAERFRREQEGRKSEAEANMAVQGMTQPVKPPSPEDQTWAMNALMQAYPGYTDWVPFNELSQTELGQWTQEMAAMLNQERRQNPGMPEQQLVDMVIRGFAASKGFTPKGVPAAPARPQQPAPQGGGYTGTPGTPGINPQAGQQQPEREFYDFDAPGAL